MDSAPSSHVLHILADTHFVANDTDPLTRPTLSAVTGTCPVHSPGACPAPVKRRARRRTRRWTLMLFVVEVIIVIALVWFAWSGGSWG